MATRWTLDGVDIDPRRIKLQIKAAMELELLNAVSAAANNLEKHISTLSNNSSNRGQGFLAVRYNAPLADAEVKVEELSGGESYEVFVPSEGKGTPGYKFNVLDQGSPGSSNPNQLFPVYKGTLTTEATFNTAGNFKSGSLDLGNVTIRKPAFFYRGPQKGFKGRRIVETVVKETKNNFGTGSDEAANMPSTAKLARSAKAKAGPFLFHIDPHEVRISTRKRSS